MAGMLAGVETARKRRIHQSSVSPILGIHSGSSRSWSWSSSNFSSRLSNSNSNSREKERGCGGWNSYNYKGDADDGDEEEEEEKLGRLAREAKQRLHQRLGNTHPHPIPTPRKETTCKSSRRMGKTPAVATATPAVNNKTKIKKNKGASVGKEEEGECGVWLDQLLLHQVQQINDDEEEKEKVGCCQSSTTTTTTYSSCFKGS